MPYQCPTLPPHVSGKEITMAVERQAKAVPEDAQASGKGEQGKATRRNHEVGRALADLAQEGKAIDYHITFRDELFCILRVMISETAW
jgi:hypothetical protein